MLLNKTAQAFTWSAERLFRWYNPVYWWTFTFVSVPGDDSMAMEAWDTLHKRLVKHLPFLHGIRVAELHKSHGVHFHAFVNERISIHLMRRLIRGTGRLVGRNHRLDFGRLAVEKCDHDTIGYMAKYLRKGYVKGNPVDFRRWGAIGGFPTNRKNDIEYESEATRNRKRIFGRLQCSYSALRMVGTYTMLYGHVDDWPKPNLALVQSQPLRNKKALIRECDPF